MYNKHVVKNTPRVSTSASHPVSVRQCLSVPRHHSWDPLPGFPAASHPGPPRVPPHPGHLRPAPPGPAPPAAHPSGPATRVLQGTQRLLNSSRPTFPLRSMNKKSLLQHLPGTARPALRSLPRGAKGWLLQFADWWDLAALLGRRPLGQPPGGHPLPFPWGPT